MHCRQTDGLPPNAGSSMHASNRNRHTQPIFPILSHHCHSLAFAAVIWVVTAAIVIKVSNTPSVFLSDERVIRPLLHVALVLVGINTLLVLYLAIYLPKIKGIQDSSGWGGYVSIYLPTFNSGKTLFSTNTPISRCTRLFNPNTNTFKS